MAKNSIRKQRKILKLEERRLKLQERKSPIAPTTPTAPIAPIASLFQEPLSPPQHPDHEDILEKLIDVDSMLRTQSSIALSQFADDNNHLQRVIQTQHLGLEGLLKQMGVEIVESAGGTIFNPEFMQADPKLVDTDDEKLHGRVARSVTPLFLRKGDGPAEDRVIRYERVMLYKDINKD